MRVDSGDDFQADAMGGGVSVGATGTATATAAGSLTHAAAGWTVDAYKGRVVFTGSVYGVVLSNTATVLTIDKWYAPADPGGAPAATPGTGAYVISQAASPANWMALTESATAPAVGDTTLPGELTGEGLQRALCTYSHTAGASTYVLSKTFTMTAGTSRTPAKAAIFNAQNGGRMVFETLVPSPPTLVPGDQVAVSDTVTT